MLGGGGGTGGHNKLNINYLHNDLQGDLMMSRVNKSSSFTGKFLKFVICFSRLINDAKIN